MAKVGGFTDHWSMAANPEPTRPFRWDVTRRERLGSLATRPCEALWFLDDLEDCAAKVLARSADARRLYFVGRSPASINDFLTGALEDTSWRSRPLRLPFSMRWGEDRKELVKRPRLLRQLEANLGALGLHPSQLQRGKGVVAFVDLVCEGHTYGHLIGLLRSWTADAGAQWDVVRTKLRWVAITEEVQPAPRHTRWQDDVPELQLLPRSAMVQIVLSRQVWRYLADQQEKVECSFPPSAWTETDGPRYDDRTLAALATAVGLVEVGRTREARHRLARRLAKETAFSERWLRSLIQELRGRPPGRQRRDRPGLGRPFPGPRHDRRLIA